LNKKIQQNHVRNTVSDWGSVRKPKDRGFSDTLKNPLCGKNRPSVTSGHIDNVGKKDDIDQIIDAAHGAGFDIICAMIIFTGRKGDDRPDFADIWRKPWDERWTIPNPVTAKPEG
jgi:hypothetical protein